MGNVLPLSDISESGIPGGRDLLGDSSRDKTANQSALVHFQTKTVDFLNNLKFNSSHDTFVLCGPCKDYMALVEN